MSDLAPMPRPHHPRDDHPSSPEGDAISPWLLVWTIFAAKVGTLAIIVWAARSAESGALIAASSIPWVVAGIGLAFGPVLFRYRLRKVRARREALQRQEWMEPERPHHREGHSTPARRR